MDFQVAVPGPFTYLVHEHARSILAIQELQREVTSLLEFRDNVLQALPHLQSRAYHSLTTTHAHDPPSSSTQATHSSHGPPTTRGESVPTKPTQTSHHMTSGDSGRQQRPISSTTTVVTSTTTTGGSNSSGSSSSSSTGGKSLSETHSTSAVADSGFSTDKAGGSMGKSSSSSAGDHLSGVEEHRWTSVEPELPLGSAEDELWQLLDVIQKKGTRLRNELERAERLERDRVNQAPPPTSSSVSDPLTSPRSHPAYRDFWPHSLPGPIGNYHSRDVLPPPPPPPPPVGMGMEAEAWAAVDRLRQDRQYLVGRVSWAEAEAAASHQRLLDLHSQLLALAGDKRRLEDQFRALGLDPRIDHRNDLNLQFVKTNGINRDGPASTGGIVHSVMGGVNTVHIVSDNTTSTTTTSSTKSRRMPPAVTVSVASGDGADDTHGAVGTRGRMFRSQSSVRVNSDRDIILPRVLKVPIRDKSQRVSKHEQDSHKDSNANPGQRDSSVKDHSNKDLSPSSEDVNLTKELQLASKNLGFKDSSYSVNATSAHESKGSDRVVIERERRAGKADGGLSMPVSLLKGGRVKVQPNKQRISAILREKDVLELQRQLLTTVMETEVLRKQVESAGEEWLTKTAEWEAETRQSHATIASLRQENLSLKTKIEERERIVRKEIGVNACPGVMSVSTMTEGELEDALETISHTVHPGPNIKYDVVVHEEDTHQTEANNNSVHSSANEGGVRKAPPAIEKPPRRSRETRPSSTIGAWNAHHHSSNQAGGNIGRRDTTGSEVAGGRDSLSRGAGVRSRANLAQSGRGTPTSTTPRSSPAPSINTRPGVGGVLRTSHSDGGRATPVGRSSSINGGTNSRSVLGRRDSLKVSSQANSNNSGNGKNGSGTGGQHKDPSLLYRDQSSLKSGSVTEGPGQLLVPRPISSPSSSLDSPCSPLALSDLETSPPRHHSPTPTTPRKVISVLEGRHKWRNRNPAEDVGKIPQVKLNAGTGIDREFREVSGVGHERTIHPHVGRRRKITTLGVDENDSQELRLSHLRCNSESSSPASSIISSNSFFDSINTDGDNNSNKLMSVEVAFEWNPVQDQEIRYLPPAAHMWTSTPTLGRDKRLLPVTGTLNSTSPRWSPTSKVPAVLGHRASQNDKNKTCRTIEPSYSAESVDQQNSELHCSADSLEDQNCGFEAVGKMKNRLRAMNGAVRVKSIDRRPSVLSMVQEPPSDSKSPVTGRKVYHGSGIATESQKSATYTYEGNSNVHSESPVGESIRLMRSRSSASPRGRSNSPLIQSDADLNTRVHQILSRIAASAQ